MCRVFPSRKIITCVVYSHQCTNTMTLVSINISVPVHTVSVFHSTSFLILVYLHLCNFSKFHLEIVICSFSITLSIIHNYIIYFSILNNLNLFKAPLKCKIRYADMLKIACYQEYFNNFINLQLTIFF